jgi:FAD/FMN-containing dehydrogenase
MISTLLPLLPRLSCPVFEPGDPEYVTELAAFHTNTVHTPAVVIGAEETADVVEAIRFAHEHGHRVSVQAGGHGAGSVSSGLMITMHRMNQVTIDVESRIATIGGGARWSDVLDAAGAHGLLPIIGSSPHVGVVGYLLGGGLSPLARSHGFSSDYVERFTVVTASGEVVEASNDKHADLFWALRGGKAIPGIVTEVRLRLVALPTIYAGSLVFEEEHIEAVVRGWFDWTQQADAFVTTSAAIITFPDLDIAPPPFRGKRLLMLRFAFPGDAVRGAELAAPLRALAPIYMDDLGEIPSTQMERIHNDPTDPLPAWTAGGQLTHVDQELATALLDRFGAGTVNPFAMAEIRHGGGALQTDVVEGSAVTGRDSSFTVFLLAMYPPVFAEMAPDAASETLSALEPWLSPVTNVNFIGHSTVSTPWSPEVQDRLDDIRGAYDPEGMFQQRW